MRRVERRGLRWLLIGVFGIFTACSGAVLQQRDLASYRRASYNFAFY